MSDAAIQFHRPDVEAPLIVWEYAFGLERRIEVLTDALARIAERAQNTGCEACAIEIDRVLS